MEGFTLTEIALGILILIVPIGAIGVGAFLVARKMLERVIDHEVESFEARVLGELEELRLRLEQISKKLDRRGGLGIGPAQNSQPALPLTEDQDGSGKHVR